MRIGIYGGTFDPVHKEHVKIARNAIKELSLDKLLIMPAGTPAHKSMSDISSKKDRKKMCELAFCDDKMEVSDFELSKKTICYSFETLEHFKKPEDQLFFIVGGDSLAYIKHWKNPERIFQLATVVSCGRVKEQTKKEFAGKVIFLDYMPDEISSTKIRVSRQFGFPIDEYVPQKVEKYIKSENLYENYRKLTKKVEKLVSERRYEHVKNATVMGQYLAPKCGVSKEDAFVALALHDVAKQFKTYESYKEELKGENVFLPEAVVHAFVGAYVARDDFKIKNKDILCAIKYHTTGRKRMSGLEKCTFVADCIEEGRQGDHVAKLREAVFADFESGFIECLLFGYQKVLGKVVCPLTKDAVEYYTQRKNKSK